MHVGDRFDTGIFRIKDNIIIYICFDVFWF